MLGTRIGLMPGGRRRVGASVPSLIDPATLFSTEDGGFYDIADRSTLFQDTAGTTAITASGQTVKRVNDKSGNGRHLTATDPLGLIYTDTGSVAYLTMPSGVGLTADLGNIWPIPFTRISALRQTSWVDISGIFDGGANGCLLWQRGATPQLTMFSGSANAAHNSEAAVGEDVVVSEVWDGAGSSIAVDNGTPTTGNPGSADSFRFVVGHLDANLGNSAAFRWHGSLYINRLLTAPETADMRAFWADRIGKVI